MSMNANYYLISGYDLTGMETDRFRGWRWTEEGEHYLCYQSKGHVQLFDDPMNGEHLYLGFIHHDNKQWDYNDNCKFTVDEFTAYKNSVDATLRYLQHIGVIKDDQDLKYSVISFIEYS